MPLVKSIWVKLSESGAKEVKDALDDVAARGEEISKMDPTLHIGVDKDGLRTLAALKVELRTLELMGADTASFRDLADAFKNVGANADGMRLKTLAAAAELRAIQDIAQSDSGGGFGRIAFDAEKAKLETERLGFAGDRAGFQASTGMERYRRSLEDLRKTLHDVNAEVDKQNGAGGGGGFFAKLGGILGTIGGYKIGPVPVGGIGLGLAAAPAFGSIFGGTMGIIPLLAAATMGVASFGALAFPTFSKVAGAIGLTGDKLRDLPNPLRSTVVAVQGVMSTFSGLAKVLGPQVMPIIRDLAPGIKQLVGDMGPFAHAVAPVLDQLAKSFSKFTVSPGFKQFLDQMLKLSGPALAVIGQGLGRVGIAIGRLLEDLINPHALTALKLVFTGIEWLIQGLGRFIQAIATAGSAVGHFVGDLVMWGGRILQWAQAAGGAINTVVADTATAVIRFFTVDIPHAGAVALTWFAALPGKIAAALGNLGSLLYAAGAAAIQGLLSGLESAIGSVYNFVSGIAAKIASLKGPIEKDKVLLYPAGVAIMAGLEGGMKRGVRNVLNVARDLGVQISDKLMDAFMSSNDKRADAAGSTIAGILRARLAEIRAYIIGIAQQEVAWASIVSAATGPAFSTPHWVRGHGARGGRIVFSHTGGPVITPGSPATRGHWAGGSAPPTGAQLLRNLNLDLGRLKAFAHVMARLRRMGLDPVLWQQILAAGPDQGFQIAEAILDAGRGEIWQLNRTEREIYQTGVGLGRTAAKSHFGARIVYVINFNGFIAGNPRAIAREIQKLLAELKRHNGGAALGIS